MGFPKSAVPFRGPYNKDYSIWGQASEENRPLLELWDSGGHRFGLAVTGFQGKQFLVCCCNGVQAGNTLFVIGVLPRYIGIHTGQGFKFPQIVKTQVDIEMEPLNPKPLHP